MCYINGHGEVGIGGTYGFLMTDDGETEKEDLGQYLTTGECIEHAEGGGDPVCRNVH